MPTKKAVTKKVSVKTFDELMANHKKLIEKYKDLGNLYNAQVIKLREAQMKLQRIQNCLNGGIF